jgi:hypothetical protein
MDRVLRLTGAPGGSQDGFDFAIRSGLVLPVDDSAVWRPLSDRGIDSLATALDGSRVGAVLLAWCGRLGIEAASPFYRSGLNRARTARLVWQAVADQTVRHPVEAIATVTLPDAYGLPASGLTFTLDLVVRARAFLAALPDGPQPPPDHWLTVPQLHELCDALLISLTDAQVAAQLADLAGIDPELVPQPANLNFVTSTDVSELLDISGLKLVPDAGASRGANLMGDPSIDVRDPDERAAQVDSWLQQIGLDAGLRGMERVLEEYHGAARDPD